MTRALVVLAHPAPQSLCAHLAGVAAGALGAAVDDLCAAGFDPVLHAGDLAAYRRAEVPPDLEERAQALTQAEVLVLVFPTWWSGMPAVLKGWFDRLWRPGLAFDAGADGRLTGRLMHLRHVVAITTHGGPWWAEAALLWPLRRMIRRGIVAPCAPAARVQWLALHRAEAVTPARLAAFEGRVRACLAGLGR